MLEELRELVCHYAREMYRHNLVTGSDGNVSARDPETGYLAITPSGYPYEQMGKKDIVIIDLDCHALWGCHMASSESPMHTYIYRKRPDVHAVMHTHSWYATVFAIAQMSIPPATQGIAVQFGGPVPCTPYVRTGSVEVGPVAIKYLGNGRGILLGNHGTLCVAPTLNYVLKLSLELEKGAKLISQALSIGAPTEISTEDIAWLHEKFGTFKNE